MSDEIKKDRSRNYPKLPLEEAIDLAKRLHQKAGKAKISPEVAVGALGYSGLSGTSLTTLGVLTQYGLIDRERGKSISVSSLSIRLIHPLGPDQELAAKREAALRPQVFNELVSEGFHKCDESLIANHLIQNAFTPDGARKAASVFIENVDFAKLNDESINNIVESMQSTPTNVDLGTRQLFSPKPAHLPPDVTGQLPPDGGRHGNVLASYSVPLGANKATITFTGSDVLSAEDFDALAEYVTIFKKQHERKLKQMFDALKEESGEPPT